MIVHKAISSSLTMTNVIEVLDFWMQKETMNKSFMTWKYKSIVYHQLFAVNNFFNNINNLIKKYLSPYVIKKIYKQMCESILYKCEKISLEDTYKFDNNQLINYNNLILIF